jgi:hypothetical protein
MVLISTSTGAPAALARSLGIKLITNGVATPTAATPPAAEVAASNSRRLLRSTLSVMTSHPFTYKVNNVSLSDQHIGLEKPCHALLCSYYFSDKENRTPYKKQAPFEGASYTSANYNAQCYPVTTIVASTAMANKINSVLKTHLSVLPHENP